MNTNAKSHTSALRLHAPKFSKRLKSSAITSNVTVFGDFSETEKMLPMCSVSNSINLKNGNTMAKIFVVTQDYNADVKCFKVDQDYNADLLVHVVDQDYQAKSDAQWFYVSNDYQASTKIFWVDQDYNADLKVFFVKEDYQAKWNKGHSLQNRL